MSLVVDKCRIPVHETEDLPDSCRVFGCYATFSEGPVLRIESAFIGNSRQLCNAELLLRSEVYPYEFFVIEYERGGEIVRKYYNEHKGLGFVGYHHN
jgi:hypothetical protein